MDLLSEANRQAQRNLEASQGQERAERASHQEAVANIARLETLLRQAQSTNVNIRAKEMEIETLAVKLSEAQVQLSHAFDSVENFKVDQNAKVRVWGGYFFWW